MKIMTAKRIDLSLNNVLVPLATNHSAIDALHYDHARTSTVILDLDFTAQYEAALDGAFAVLNYRPLYGFLAAQPCHYLEQPLEHFMDEAMDALADEARATGIALRYQACHGNRRNLICGAPRLFAEVGERFKRREEPMRRVGTAGMPMAVTWDHRNTRHAEIEPTSTGIRHETLSVGFDVCYPNVVHRPKRISGLFDWVPALKLIEERAGKVRVDLVENLLDDLALEVAAVANQQGIDYREIVVQATRTAFSRGHTVITMTHCYREDGRQGPST